MDNTDSELNKFFNNINIHKLSSILEQEKLAIRSSNPQRLNIRFI